MGGLRINKISKALGTFTGSSTDPLLTSNAATGKVDTATNSFSALPNGTIWIGNAVNVPVPQLITGDITISNTGVAAIGAGVIVNGDISASAGITLTKLAPLGFSLALVSDGLGFIVTSVTTAAQIGFLSTTTSDIQVQINGKQATITGAASTVVTANLNPNIVPVTDGSGKFISSLTTTTALGYINNLTSDAQAQINQKLSVALGVAALGDILYYNGSNWTNFPKGTNGQILTTSGGTLTWGSATANGLPVGGTAAQFLAKNSGTNFDAGWFTLTTSLITDILATAAQINASTTYLTAAGVPTGTNNQVLTISGGIMGWSSVGSGTVTSVQVAGGTTGLTFSGGPITTSGTITMAGTLGVVNGGTAQTAVAIGDLLYGSGVNTWSRLAAGTNGFVLTLSAGIPTWASAGAGSFWLITGNTTITGNTSQTGNFTNTFQLNRVAVNQNALSGTFTNAFLVTGGSHTNIPAGTDVIDVLFDLSRNITMATGAVPSFRSVVITPPAVNFVGASVVAAATGLAVSPVSGGTNATLTASSAITVTNFSALTNVVSSYGLTVNTASGATNNYAARFLGGSVGIGTSVPTYPLQIETAGSNVMLVRSTATFAILDIDSTTSRSFVRFNEASVPLWQLGTVSGGGFRIFDQVAALARMVILNTGNVGINTTTPDNKLTMNDGNFVLRLSDVNQSLIGVATGGNSLIIGTVLNDLALRTYGGSILFSTDTGNSALLTLKNTGNVGIGTTVPASVLTVTSATNASLGFFQWTGNANNPRVAINAVAQKITFAVTASSTNATDLSFSVPLFPDTMLLQGSTGRVGIGTSIPAEDVHVVSGTALGTGLRLQSSTAGGRVWAIRSNDGGGTGSFNIIDVTSASTRISLTAAGTVVLPSLSGSSTTTVTVTSTGVLGRTAAIGYDISNNVLVNNSIFFNSDLNFTNGVNIFTGLITGTMFGTSDLQKLSFYGQIPNRQPDTGVTPLTKLTFGGSPVGELDTFGGYTIGQVVAALQQLGLLQ